MADTSQPQPGTGTGDLVERVRAIVMDALGPDEGAPGWTGFGLQGDAEAVAEMLAGLVRWERDAAIEHAKRILRHRADIASTRASASDLDEARYEIDREVLRG